MRARYKVEQEIICELPALHIDGRLGRDRGRGFSFGIGVAPALKDKDRKIMGLMLGDFADKDNVISALILEMCFTAKEGGIFRQCREPIRAGAPL